MDDQLDPGPEIGPSAPAEAVPGRARRRRRRRRLTPAFVSGTSSEFLGRRPLPTTARERTVVFVLGPTGVGKSAVARRLLDTPDILRLDGAELQEALTAQARRRTWREDIRKHPALILDGPCYLQRRPAVVRVLRQLLQARAADGLRTMICEGPDRSPLTELMDAVEGEDRATIALRFPVGRGCRRFAARVCDELGLDRHKAMLADDLEPWTYDAVVARLTQVRDEQRRELRSRRRFALRVCQKLHLPAHMADRVMDLEPFDKELVVRTLAELMEEQTRGRRRKKRH